jgi:hypothetical protein
LQWQEISLPWPLLDDTAALLPQLPSVTALSLDASSLTHFDFLQRLPSLTSAHCSFSGMPADHAHLLGDVVAALCRCTSITDLRLSFCDGLTAAHLSDLLPRLPRLHSLALVSLGVESLSFLSVAPLTDHLSSLTLAGCAKLPVAELCHVHSLRGLRELFIFGSFDESLAPECAALVALRPPSAALPRLESFSYRPPQIAPVQSDGDGQEEAPVKEEGEDDEGVQEEQ